LQEETEPDSQYTVYMRGIKNIKKSLQDDEEYTTYMWQGKMIKANEGIIENVVKEHGE
jgi:hypothetical protein